jgi:hypothetical protein
VRRHPKLPEVVDTLAFYTLRPQPPVSEKTSSRQLAE